MRRLITAIKAEGALDTIRPSVIVNAGRRFGVKVELTRDKSRVVLPTNKADLKTLLRLLNNNLLASELTGNGYQVTSKRPV